MLQKEILRSNLGNLDILPDEILHQIIQYLYFKDLVSFSRTAKYIYDCYSQLLMNQPYDKQGNIILHKTAMASAMHPQDKKARLKGLIKLGAYPWKENSAGQTFIDLLSTDIRKEILDYLFQKWGLDDKIKPFLNNLDNYGWFTMALRCGNNETLTTILAKPEATNLLHSALSSKENSIFFIDYLLKTGHKITDIKASELFADVRLSPNGRFLIRQCFLLQSEENKTILDKWKNAYRVVIGNYVISLDTCKKMGVALHTDLNLTPCQEVMKELRNFLENRQKPIQRTKQALKIAFFKDCGENDVRIVQGLLEHFKNNPNLTAEQCREYLLSAECEKNTKTLPGPQLVIVLNMILELLEEKKDYIEASAFPKLSDAQKLTFG